MSNQILPNAVSLITLSDDELREELLKDVYNKANLREMIRRLAKLTRDNAESVEHHREAVLKHRAATESFHAAIRDFE